MNNISEERVREIVAGMLEEASVLRVRGNDYDDVYADGYEGAAETILIRLGIKAYF